MLVSNGQSLIQSTLYEGREPSELEKLLWKYLDDALAKLPTEDTTEIVYRNTNNNIFTPADVRKEMVYPAYLTASKKCLNTNCNCVYVIHLAGRTKARSIYRAYEIMQELPEEQVEFPRNTKFFVEDICSKGGKTLVELWELPDQSWPSEKLSGNDTRPEAIKMNIAVNPYGDRDGCSGDSSCLKRKRGREEERKRGREEERKRGREEEKSNKN